MIVQLGLAIVLAQSGYVRSRVNSNDNMSQCLWWPENTAITLHQNVDGNPENAGESSFTAFKASVTTWSQQLNSCSSLTLTDGERTTSRQTGLFRGEENQNVVLFRFRKCTDVVAATDACWHPDNDDCGTKFDCWQHQEAAIAITTTSYNPDTGRILDSDIEFNKPSFVFTTVDAPPCIPPAINQGCVATDIQNTATHELGHLLGLSHIGQAASTMAPTAQLGELKKRALDSGTARFVCEAYPAGLPSKTCLLKTVSPELGKPVGCSATPGAFAALLLVGLLRRRRRE